MHHPVLAQIPNAITVARLILSFILFVMLGLASTKPQDLPSMWLFWAFVVFFVAAITDVIDGALARRWNVTSGFGRVVDPFVDKILVLGCFVMFCGPNFMLHTEGGYTSTSGVLPWLVVVLIARELLITVLRQVIESRGQTFGADWSGKLKTFIQLFAIGAVLIHANYFPSYFQSPVYKLSPTLSTIGLWIRDVSLWATAGITVLSGVLYIRRVLKVVGLGK
jgi:CDP-diacylglycerol---glycerol-3-phosphate 3-phosphatidyltransferase